MEPVCPQFMMGLGWRYRSRGKATTLISTSHIRTRADAQYGMPFNSDRTVLLYLLPLAMRGPSARFDALEIARWFGAGWRRTEMVKKLYRVLRARIDLPIGGEWKTLEITEHYQIYKETGEVYIEFANMFRDMAETAIGYDLAVARRLVDRMTVLDLYFLCLYWLFQAEHRAHWYPYEVLWSPKSNSKTGQQLVQRLAVLDGVWSANPFAIGDRHYQLVCSEEAFHEYVYGFNRASHERELEQQMVGVRPGEFQAYLETLAPWMRQSALHVYTSKILLPQMRADVGAALDSPPMNDEVDRAEAALAESRQLMAKALAAMVANGNQQMVEAKAVEPASNGQTAEAGDTREPDSATSVEDDVSSAEESGSRLARVLALPRTLSERARGLFTMLVQGKCPINNG